MNLKKKTGGIFQFQFYNSPVLQTNQDILKNSYTITYKNHAQI